MGNLFKVVDNRTTVSRKLAALKEMLEDFPKEVFRDLAAIVVDASPVDTGTYMDNHHISDIGKRQYPRGTENTDGKPQRQAREPYADAALGRLGAEIDAMPEDGKWAYFYNTSKHAPHVEAKYHPYEIAKSNFPVIVEAAWRSVGGN
jgi:hypothetical protein